MINWSDEIEARPLPTFLASAGMLAVVIGHFTTLFVFYGLAGWFWVTSLQLTIWRAAQALKEK